MNHLNDSQYLQLEIRATVLNELINNGIIVAADIHALNRSSSEGVKALVLESLRSRNNQ